MAVRFRWGAAQAESLRHRVLGERPDKICPQENFGKRLKR